MKAARKLLLPALGAAAVAGAAVYLIAPARARKEQKAPFLGANIAHRGLHTRDKSVPENSLAAFAAAVEHGYGVEFDVHITADGKLVVFHDDSLQRVCGVNLCIDDLTWEQLQQYTLAGTEQRIPLLSEVLEVIGGKVPIVLELKRGRRNDALCEGVYQALRTYSGPICIESFDPRLVRWWYKHAPEMLRGQLSNPAADFKGELKSPAAWVLSHLLTNFLCRPQFIAYGIEGGKKPLTVRLCEALGAMKVCWTSHDPVNENGNDTVIFEFYRPRRKFR